MSTQWTGTWCPQCGPDVSCDDDGCCSACGATAVGEGTEQALALRASVDPTHPGYRCPLACPHGDRCTLPRGHEGGHNHRGCDCNEPDQPPCDQCGERKPVETITGSGTSFYVCAACKRNAA